MPRTARRPFSFVATLSLSCIAFVGCSDNDDNHHITDAALRDGSTNDARSPDAAAPDSTAFDAVTPDGHATDGQLPDATGPDAAGPDASGPDAATAQCGNGILEIGENCDDGVIQQNCDTYHDGGDGACVPPGTCSPNYTLNGNGFCVPIDLTADVWIDVDNFCNMTVTPLSFTVAAGQTLTLTYHNISAWYEVDVWLSYGGGYLDLQTGHTWADSITHCTGPNPYTAYADIDTACSGYRLNIYCQ